MGSDETAITIPGALEKLTFFTGTGRHRVQIIYFFWMQIGPRTPTGVVLIVGSHLHRMRWRLGLSRELWIQNIEDSALEIGPKTAKPRSERSCRLRVMMVGMGREHQITHIIF